MAASVAALTVYDMAKGIDSGLVDRRGATAREDEGTGVKAAVADRLRRRCRRRARGRERRPPRRAARRGRLRRAAACRPGRARGRRGRHRRAVRAGAARADDRRDGFGAARRDARGDAEVLERPAPGIAEAIRADAVAKTPHGLLSRGLAGRPRARRSSSTSPARRAAAATGTPSSARRSSMRSPCSRAQRPRTGRRERPRPRPAAALRVARQDRAHRLRAAVRLRRRASSRSTPCPRRATCSGSPSRWSALARSRWASTG